MVHVTDGRFLVIIYMVEYSPGNDFSYIRGSLRAQSFSLNIFFFFLFFFVCTEDSLIRSILSQLISVCVSENHQWNTDVNMFSL